MGKDSIVQKKRGREPLLVETPTLLRRINDQLRPTEFEDPVEPPRANQPAPSSEPVQHEHRGPLLVKTPTLLIRLKDQLRKIEEEG
jgi:hypothetical protein